MALRRNLLMQKVDSGGLPAEYQQIEWLGNSGTQYIITNYYPSADNVEVTMDYAITATQSGDGLFWGSQGSATSQTWQCELYDDRAWYIGIGVKQFRNVLPNVGKTALSKHTLHATADLLTIDGSSVSPTESRGNKRNQNMFIFAWRQAIDGLVGYINKGCRIYSLEFKEDGAISANFVPCIRKSDSEPGMYDTVSGTFYTNAGTGTFLTPT